MSLRPELVESLGKINFVSATEVQERAIPVALSGKDIIVRAKTGTGKTAAFLVPIFQRIQKGDRNAALIIAPTRELALQVTDVAAKIGRHMGMRVTTVYGGASINVQTDKLARGVNIVVGTPGRLIDLMERRALDITEVKWLVLDEADIMLDMGFIDDIEYIASRTPKKKQTMLFSATMPHEIIDIARKYMIPGYESIIVGKEEDLTVNSIEHNYVISSGRTKFATLLAYINEFLPKKGIIFSSTKHEANLIHAVLVKQGINAILMHGGLTQAMRERSLSHFRNGAQFLIATNIASRGLDIADVTDVINFDAPDDPRVYVHRVGRSARMGKDGRAFTIFSPDQMGLMRSIQYTANVQMKQIKLDIEQYKNIEIPRTERRRRFGGDFKGGRGGDRGGFRGHGRGYGSKEHRGSGEHRGFRGGYDGDNRGGYGHRRRTFHRGYSADR